MGRIQRSQDEIAESIRRAWFAWKQEGETDEAFVLRQFRMIGTDEEEAIRSARIVSQFRFLSGQGTVEICQEEDDQPYDFGCTLDGLTPTEIRDYKRMINRLGVWGVISRVQSPITGEWETADGIWGCAGYERPTSYLENSYVVDLMSSAIDQYHKLYPAEETAPEGWQSVTA